MAASGSQTIQLYYSTTTGASPVAGNLASGELALNITDGRLFYKDNGGNVQTLASRSATSGSFSDITVSGNATFSGGTANGVAYLNGSKVLTTGSALTFDGNALTLGGSVPLLRSNMSGSQSSRFGIQNSTANGNTRFYLYPNGTGTISAINMWNNSDPAAVNYSAFDVGIIASSDIRFSSQTSGTGTLLPFTWQFNGSEQMRLTSTGLGIGTSSPGARVDAAGNIRVSYAASAANASLIANNTSSAASSTSQIIATNDASRALRIQYSSSGGIGGSAISGGFTGEMGQIFTDNNYPLSIGTGSVARLNIDTSGNLGLGVTPSAWNSAYKVLNFAWASLSSENVNQGGMRLNVNAYADSSGYNNWYRAQNAAATSYKQNDGVHSWYTAAYGTAGSAISFTQAMTLDASGNLLVGLTTGAKFSVSYGGNDTHFGLGANYDNYITAGSSGVTIFRNSTTERARITSDGTLLIRGGAVPAINAYDAPFIFRVSGGGLGLGGSYETGGTSPIVFYTQGSERARITSGGSLLVGTTSDSARLTVDSGSTGLMTAFNSTNANGGYCIYQASGTTYGDIGTAAQCVGGSASDFSLNARGARNLVFGTNNTERARIDSSGNLLVGKTSTDEAVQGLQLVGPSGLLVVTRNNGDPLSLRRTSSDGAIASFRRDATLVGTISVTTSATAYNTSSDYRLKENIQPMTGALAKVAALKPVTYTWKADGSDGEGFIAHELAEVVPQCVTGEKDAVDENGNPKYQGIDTSFLVATLTAAIQEQQAIIEQLKADVAALKGA